MIRLDRIRTTANVPVSFRGTKRVERENELIGLRRAGTLVFKSAQWKAAKPGLKAEARGKCAYCESRASAGYPCDVEHVRPKDVHWWLAWCYENYAFSCFLCNNKKSNQFPRSGVNWPVPSATTPIATLAGTLTPDPIDAAAGLGSAQYAARHRAEDAHLLHPYLDDPATLLAFEADATEEAVTVVPRPGNAAASRAVTALIDCCDINRDDLSRDRYERFELLEVVKDAWLARNALPPATVATAKEKLLLAQSPRRPYSAMATYFIRDVWNLDLT